MVVQQPQNFDTACVLARLQEEVADPCWKHEFKKMDFFHPVKHPMKSALPLPAPPRLDRPLPPFHAEDKSSAMGGRGRPTDDRITALRTYRRAKGLCVKCAE